jgi:excisionase family DNA binding protein
LHVGILEGKEKREMLQRKFLTVKEVSEYIGIKPDTIYTMVSQRRIPFTKVGKLVKFDQTALDAWLKQHTVMPMSTKTY